MITTEDEMVLQALTETPAKEVVALQAGLRVDEVVASARAMLAELLSRKKRPRG